MFVSTRRASRRVAWWLAGGGVAWLAAVVWAPAALTPASSTWARGTAAAVYLVGGTVCHQRPERSFVRAGRPLPVCGRCLGLYVGGALGLVAGAVAASRRLPGGAASRRWLALAALPTVATVMLEATGVAPVTSVVRALAAIPFAAVAGWLLATAPWTRDANLGAPGA